jgi:hypothetical protein
VILLVCSAKAPTQSSQHRKPAENEDIEMQAYNEEEADEFGNESLSDMVSLEGLRDGRASASDLTLGGVFVNT